MTFCLKFLVAIIITSLTYFSTTILANVTSWTMSSTTYAQCSIRYWPSTSQTDVIVTAFIDHRGDIPLMFLLLTDYKSGAVQTLPKTSPFGLSSLSHPPPTSETPLVALSLLLQASCADHCSAAMSTP
ncbi:hypothetical protein CPB85DRAFT_892863 [Mucidula mucida]|nr:hypothetical protein CPB85DRAFT_892863 [Mucidula mucida]